MQLTLKTEKREITGKKVQKLRDEGKIPAVMYGQETEPVNLTVEYIPFEKIYEKAGESTLVHLKINSDEEIPVLISQIARNHVSDKIDHIDFYKIKYGQKLTARVELKFIGEPKAVKELGGILVTKMNEIEIECLPKDLISEIKVDLTKLQAFDDIIHSKDLNVPETIKIMASEDEVVASIAQPRLAEEKPTEEAEETAEGEEKKEEGKEEGKPEEKKEEGRPEEKK
ncbi:50S ribosomal protein L25 [Candidatus Falkowbacteria bacterium]|jgi:large subunit ribosomal protein L25|nr:50S ribosomal protein L25 [Candidatus Falkowbacteria bacterium]MBT4433282.1 50S ribosomal protein L25 [Candidatus Falkowbacteria bacterium]